MPADRILVIDAGTSALRAVAVSTDGRAERLASTPWAVFRPADGGEYARELDGVGVEDALRRLLAVCAGANASFGAVACTGQREGVVFVDAAGRAVLISPNIDARAATEGAAIDAAAAEEVYARTGHLPSLLLAKAKGLWLERHRPEDAARVVAALPLADWMARVVTGRTSDALSATACLLCEIGLLDVTTRAPLPDAAAMNAVDCGHVVGGVHDGPLAGTPVVLAGGDTQCGTLGAGALRAHDCALTAGWSAPLQLVTDRPLLDEKRRTWTGRHAAPGRWILESSAGDTGRAWDAVCELVGVTAAQGMLQADDSAPGAADVLMVLGQAPMNAGAMTMRVGALTFPTPLAMWPLDRGRILRATLEAAAFAVRANVEQIEEVAGERVEEVRLGGGMSAADLFARILADVLDRRVLVARSADTTAVGAAALAFQACGRFASLEEAVRMMARPRATVTPDARASAAYDDCYARWRLLVRHMELAP